MKLSVPQTRMLQYLVKAGSTGAWCRGYRHPTRQSLLNRGLVERTEGWRLRITDAGREAIA